ncbi:hypothetical protein RJ640_029380 [Escallonia rubra]|uniref:NB-ARC domain-containing protein n=1 Tax=Escallonia rubra TaxID=112253 RepID=A0AA88UQ01_9ASTE|nr:hypothetical protein RJ640_029380 [Escallonia rubra]
MELNTVKEGITKVLNLLKAHHVETVVLVGEPGIGKTWTAREVSYQAIDEGLFDITLWAYLNGKCDTALLSECKSLLESIAHQLYLLPTLEECEVEYDNVEAEIGSYLWEKISENLAEKRLLLIVEIYGPSNMVEEEIVSAFRTLLKLNQQSYKVVITRISRNALLGSSRVSELEPLSVEDSVIELKPLSVQEASRLLREKAGADAYNVPGIKALAENFIIKTKRLPVTIAMMAKALRYCSASESAVRMLKRTLEGAPENPSYSIKQLLHSGYDMLPNSILMDLCWHGSHYFRDFRSVYFNELIAYWMVEGFLGRVNCIEQAYNDGHRVLMELIDCGVVKKLDEGYVFINREDLNLDEFRCHIKQEENCTYLDECYRGGSYGTNSLGLATVFDGKWEGFGKITQTNGMMKTICSSKQGHKLSTLLIDENNICWEVLVKLLTSDQELQVLGLFNWKLKSLSAILSNCANLQVLLVRSCSVIENINQTLNLEKLVVLEISGASSLKEIPDVFGNMPNLQSINLSELLIDKLPSSFYKLSELVWLILRGCSCFKEMESLANMKKLIVLDLSRSTSFKTFKDPTFEKNPELRMLNLSETLISSVPIMFKKIRNLTHLLRPDLTERLEKGDFNYFWVRRAKHKPSINRNLFLFSSSGQNKHLKLKVLLQERTYEHLTMLAGMPSAFEAEAYITEPAPLQIIPPLFDPPWLHKHPAAALDNPPGLHHRRDPPFDTTLASRRWWHKSKSHLGIREPRNENECVSTEEDKIGEKTKTKMDFPLNDMANLIRSSKCLNSQ